MKPLLKLVGHPHEQLPSLLQGVITRQYSIGHSQYFFTLYPETGSEASRGSLTSRYLVVLNSIDGTHAFYLEQNEQGDFVKESEDYWDEPEDLTTERMIMQVEGVHLQREKTPEDLYCFDDDLDLLEALAYKEVNCLLAHWVNSGGEDLVLPLINAAIKEYHTGR